MGNIGAVCDGLNQLVRKITSWPVLGGIRRGIDSMHAKLRPILSFFSDVRSTLDREVCVKLIFRRRCIRLVRVSLVTIGTHNNIDSYCYCKLLNYSSVGGVLDGVSGLIDTILRPLNIIIDRLVSKAPSFNLPGESCCVCRA